MQALMKQIAINLTRLLTIMFAVSTTIYAASKSSQTIIFLICGLIFKDFFSSSIYDPIFKQQSAQGWAISGIKKWASRRKPIKGYDV